MKDAAVKLTRQEAVACFTKQINSLDETRRAEKFSCWHYGKIELQELLDQIYGKNSRGEDVIALKPAASGSAPTR